ncbi:MAG: hypothetical protein H6993_18155 [Pseudomonadales bacterium]|nr:hypothetical protein [Pseudomonadales bacterium]MCP5185894.1 hypothetical protein [Pseudomonadales bacterium]
MQVHRRNEPDHAWFRSQRTFASDGFWYFSTREGIELGPYPSHADADRDARRLRDRLAPMCPGKQSKVVICAFIVEARDHGRQIVPQFTRAVGAG